MAAIRVRQTAVGTGDSRHDTSPTQPSVTSPAPRQSMIDKTRGTGMDRHALYFAAVCWALVTGCAATPRPPRAQPQASVWVCHGGRSSKWQRVAAPAADAHRRHGDVVTATPQREGSSCR